MKRSSNRPAKSLSPPASKFFELKALADLLVEELKNKATMWPEGAVTAAEVRQIRREAGLPSGGCATQKFIYEAKKAGRAEVFEGVVLKGHKYVRTTKYLFK